MAQVTKQYTETSGPAKATWVLRSVGYRNDYTASSSNFYIENPIIYGKYINNSGATKTCGKINISSLEIQIDSHRVGFLTAAFHPHDIKNTRWYPNSERQLCEAISISVPTSTIFNTSNKNSKTAGVYITSNSSDLRGRIDASSWDGYIEDRGGSSYAEYGTNVNNGRFYGYAGRIGPLATVTLNAPPTFNCSSELRKNSLGYYAGYTTVEADVSSISIKYGGDIKSVVLTVGSASKTIYGNGTISLLLNRGDVGKTVTPKITVTDSRGQSTVKNLKNITISDFSPPNITYSIDRVNTSYIKDDEGTNALFTVNLTYDENVSTLVEPEVTITDGGAQITADIVWYKTLNGNIPSNPIDSWSNVRNSDMPIYALVKSTDPSTILFNTQKSYDVVITPISNIGRGVSVNNIVASAFYTIDFLAGGHGIAFGKPSTQDGFECEMDVKLNNNVEIKRYPLADFVIEEGTSGQWKYRKWYSGILEQWYVGNPGSYTLGTQRGNLYSGGAITYTYPIQFTETPRVLVNATLATQAYVVWAQASVLSLASIEVRIVSGSSISSSNGYNVHIYAVGTWK